jgi:hypothetical protein
MKISPGIRAFLLTLCASGFLVSGGAAQIQPPKGPVPPPKFKAPEPLKMPSGPKQPSLVSFRVTDGPFLGFEGSTARPTKIEAELANFDPKADTFFRPSLWAPGCYPNGLFPSSEPGGSPYKVKWDIGFFGIENSGKRCPMEIHPYREGMAPPIAAGEIRLPSLETYTITHTWDLLNFTTPSGKKLSASASKGPLVPCELGSVGTAGTFSTGVVNDNGDLSFQLRNGLFQEDCRFETSTALVVKPGWFVKKVDWQFTSDSLCNAGNSQFGLQASSGQTVTFFFDSTAIFQVRFEATCRPDESHREKNSHLYKARLVSIELVGPPGQKWQDAFK